MLHIYICYERQCTSIFTRTYTRGSTLNFPELESPGSNGSRKKVLWLRTRSCATANCMSYYVVYTVSFFHVFCCIYCVIFHVFILCCIYCVILHVFTLCCICCAIFSCVYIDSIYCLVFMCLYCIVYIIHHVFPSPPPPPSSDISHIF